MTTQLRRIPAVVIRAVRDAVPKNRVKFRRRLEEIARDSGFQAPESPLPWLKLRDALESHVGKPHENWHFKVIEIVQTHPGTPEEEK